MYYCGLSVTNKGNAAVVVNNVNENYRLVLDFTCDQNGINKLVNDLYYNGINNQNTIFCLRFFYKDTEEKEDYQKIFFVYSSLKKFYLNIYFLKFNANLNTIELKQKNVYEYYNTAFKIALYIKKNISKNILVDNNFSINIKANKPFEETNYLSIYGFSFLVFSIYLLFKEDYEMCILSLVISIVFLLSNGNLFAEQVKLKKKDYDYIYFDSKVIKVFDLDYNDKYWQNSWENIKSVNYVIPTRYSSDKIIIKSFKGSSKTIHQYFGSVVVMKKLNKTLNFYMYNFGNNK